MTMRSDGRYVPVDIDLTIPGTPVTWIDATQLRLAHPRFDQSIRHLVATRDAVASFRSPLEALLSPEDAVGSAAPTAFVFHVSRCGSTALVNALQQIEHCLVAAEMPAVSGLLAPHDWSAEAVDLASCLRALVWRIGTLRSDPAAPYFVKLTSWNALRLKTFANLWPHTPWFFVTRSPAEVVVAQMENRDSRRGWLSWRRFEADVQALTGWERAWIDRASDAEYCARMVGALLQSAVDRSEGRILMHYPMIGSTTLNPVLNGLGLILGEAEQYAIDQSFKRYSKDPSGSSFFMPDDRLKQKQVTAEILSACSRWADPACEALLAAGKSV